MCVNSFCNSILKVCVLRVLPFYFGTIKIKCNHNYILPFSVVYDNSTLPFSFVYTYFFNNWIWQFYLSIIIIIQQLTINAIIKVPLFLLVNACFFFFFTLLILDLFYGTMHLVRGMSVFLSAECFVPGLCLCQWGIVHLRCVDLPPFAVTIQFHQATINNFLRTLINH